MNSLCSTSSQKILDRLRTMDTGAIPHDQQFTRNVAQHMPQKAYDIITVIRLLLDVQQQLTAWSDRTDRRQVIITTGCAQHRWVAFWRPRTHQSRQQIEPGFVYPDEGSSLAFGFFLIAGHFSLRQRSIAASLRSVARSIGFCTLQPIARRRRPI